MIRELLNTTKLIVIIIVILAGIKYFILEKPYQYQTQTSFPLKILFWSLVVCILILMILGVVMATLYVIKYFLHLKEVKPDKHGNYPSIPQKVSTVLPDGTIKQETRFLNPLGVTPVEPEIDQEIRQAKINYKSQGKMLTPKDEVNIVRKHLLLKKGRQLDKPKTPKRPKPEGLPIKKRLPDIETAFQYSTPEKWILGGNDTQNLCHFVPKNDGHILVLGSNGQGKTKSTGLILAQYGLLYNYNVIALDGKFGVDWMKYTNFHSHELTPENMFIFLKGVENEMKRRAEILKDQGFESLHTAHDQKQLLHIPKTLVIFEELCSNLNDNGAFLGQLMRRLRITGIHFVLIEQSPDSGMLTNGIKANAKYIIYKLPSHQFRVINASKEVQKLPVGCFECDNIQFRAWNLEDRQLKGTVQWDDFLAPPKEKVGPKVQKVIEYITANPTATKKEIMKVCKVSEYTVAQARRVISG